MPPVDPVVPEVEQSPEEVKNEERVADYDQDKTDKLKRIVSSLLDILNKGPPPETPTLTEGKKTANIQKNQSLSANLKPQTPLILANLKGEELKLDPEDILKHLFCILI